MRTFTTVIAIFTIHGAAIAQNNDSDSPPNVAAIPATAFYWDIDGSDPLPTDVSDELTAAEDAASASNPLSSTSKLDLRIDYFDVSGSDRFDINARGDVMLHPRVKLAYEVHYWSTDITGSSEDDWERLVLRPLFFIDDVELSEQWAMRIATGIELIFDADNAAKGIGSGSDQVGPLFGLAFSNRESGLTLIPFVQQFVSYDGPSVNTTAFRLIALKPLPNSMWLKIDAKAPYDWESNTFPASLEVEFGKMLSPKFGVFGTGFVGIGGDRPYDYGIGAAARIRF